jgi:aminotransferase EvaB
MLEEAAEVRASISPVESAQTVDLITGYDARKTMQNFRSVLMESLQRVLDSGALILGSEVAAFEQEFATFVECEHAIGMSSGTDALIVALKALGVGHGDEVITVANGPVPTAAAIRAVGATPCFVDIDPNHLQMDPVRLRDSIRRTTRCVIPIHLYGHAAPILEISRICQEHELFLIEDCAQAHGTRFADKHVGGFGHVGCFSFYPTKNLGALGDAGMCVTDDPVLANKIREVGQYGFRDNQRIAYLEGLNARLDELQAAFLRPMLRCLESKLTRRSEIAEYYRDRLTGLPFLLPAEVLGTTSSWHQFVLRCKQRDKLLEFLKGKGVIAGIHYQWPVHKMPPFCQPDTALSPMLHTETACREVISLPMYPELEPCHLKRVVDSVIEASRHGIE